MSFGTPPLGFSVIFSFFVDISAMWTVSLQSCRSSRGMKDVVLEESKSIGLFNDATIRLEQILQSCLSKKWSTRPWMILPFWQSSWWLMLFSTTKSFINTKRFSIHVMFSFEESTLRPRYYFNPETKNLRVSFGSDEIIVFNILLICFRSLEIGAKTATNCWWNLNLKNMKNLIVHPFKNCEKGRNSYFHFKESFKLDYILLIKFRARWKAEWWRHPLFLSST